jgi:hypothetical protein
LKPIKLKGTVPFGFPFGTVPNRFIPSREKIPRELQIKELHDFMGYILDDLPEIMRIIFEL